MKKLLLGLVGLSCCLVAGESADARRMSKPACDSGALPLFQRGDDSIETMPMSGKYPAAYNLAANVDLDRGWDVYGDISYLYWFIYQEGLDLAVTAEYGMDETFILESGGYPVFQDANYTSGFKVGLGGNLNVDDWVLDAEYTYLRQSTTTSKTAPASDAVGYPGVFSFTGWFFDTYYSEDLVAPSFKSKWKFGLDWIDLTIKRPFYSGLKLTATPSFGLRASWIRQNLDITSYNGIYADADEGTDVSKNSSHSWGIGPRGVVDLHWLIGKGFRFQGILGGSLLFTQYTRVSHLSPSYDEIVGGAPFVMKNYNCIRPMAEANLGFGWGRYFSQNRYRCDLSATYDFNFLWGQNMLKYMVNLGGFGQGASPYDLYMHGLTVKFRLDF